MNREKMCLLITAAICVFGCAFLSVYNAIEADYVKAEVILPTEYSQAVDLESSVESVHSTASDEAGSTGKININTASVQQLADFLPGIGPAKARAIVEYRELAGRFVSVDELIRVDGIGEKTLENIRPYCCVDD